MVQRFPPPGTGLGTQGPPLPKVIITVIITVIRDYIPVIVIIIRIGVSYLVLRDGMTRWWCMPKIKHNNRLIIGPGQSCHNNRV